MIAAESKQVCLIGGGNTDHPTVPCRKGRGGDAIVTGSRHQHRPFGPGIIDGILEILAVVGVAEAHEDYVGAVVGSPNDTADYVAVLTFAIGSQHRNRHDLHILVGHSGYSDPVICHGGNDAGKKGPMAVLIGKAVTAVKDRDARNDCGGEVGVGAVHSGIQKRHSGVPRRGHRAENLVPADLGQAPLHAVVGIGGDRIRLTGLIYLDTLNLRVGLVGLEHQRQVEIGNRNHVKA